MDITEYLAGLGQAVRISAARRQWASGIGAIIEEDNKNRKAHFGGLRQDHTVGKLGEYAVACKLREHGIIWSHDPVRMFYDRLDPMDDFIVLARQRCARDPSWKIEVKTGLHVWKGLQGVSVANFGLQVPVEQLDRDCDAYVYVIMDAAMSRACPIGWCRRSALEGYEIKRNVQHPCKRVPISDLQPMGSFYSLFKTVSVSNNSSSMKV